tara:strand:+ start:361 stop:537 length:177 start_codon:yes stop_codon:yes gene_type:complete
MPVSKHRKKGRTARQFRKNRNNRRAERAAEEKLKKLGMMRAARIINQNLKEAEENERI